MRLKEDGQWKRGSVLTLIEQIQQRLSQLPPGRQSEVLDFVAFLQQRSCIPPNYASERRLDAHPAFGSWKGRKINALEYEQVLRGEWENHE